MDFTICKKLEDCVCENCIYCVATPDNNFCRANPTSKFTSAGYWCSDGQWMCEFYGHSGVLKHEVLFRSHFIQHLFYNDQDAQYREQKRKAREEFLSEADGTTTEEQLDALFYKAGIIFDDLYKIKKELGMPLP